MTNYARVIVGDKSGTILAELEPDLGPVLWRLNGEGSLTFSIDKNDAKTTAENLRIGNRIMVDFDNGLPAWGGVIDLPRGWDNDQITINCFGAERKLKQRLTGKNKVFTTQTVGGIIKAVLEDAEIVAPFGIAVGSTFYLGGDTFTISYHHENLADIFEDLLTTFSDFDFAVDTALTNGLITFTARLEQRAGAVKSRIALLEGHNLTGISLGESGPIQNSWYTIGAGDAWGDDRPVGTASDTAAIASYDLREAARPFHDLSAASDLNSQAAFLLAENKDPRNLFKLTAIDLAPALFADYVLGDTVKLQTPSFGFGAGFDGSVRILARAWDPKTGACDLVVREV